MWFYIAVIFGAIAIATAPNNFWCAVALLFVALLLAEKSGKRESRDV